MDAELLWALGSQVTQQVSDLSLHQCTCLDCCSGNDCSRLRLSSMPCQCTTFIIMRIDSNHMALVMYYPSKLRKLFCLVGLSKKKIHFSTSDCWEFIFTALIVKFSTEVTHNSTTLVSAADSVLVCKRWVWLRAQMDLTPGTNPHLKFFCCTLEHTSQILVIQFHCNIPRHLILCYCHRFGKFSMNPIWP